MGASGTDDDAAQVAAELAGTPGVAATLDVSATASGFESVGTDVTIPADAGGAIELGSAEGDVSLGLPGGKAAEGVLVADQVVYTNVVPETNLVAQATAGGVQVLITIESDTAPTRFDFPVSIPDGTQLVDLPDGSVAILESVVGQGSGVTQVEIGRFEPAWAIDAAGLPVPTHHEVNGTTITQVIAPSADAVYPIVADPKFSSSWWGYTLKFNAWETNKLIGATWTASGLSAAVAAACGASTAGLCGVPLVLATALFATSAGVLQTCSNSKGVDIHWTKFPVGTIPVIWCSGY